jgi:hypothetical protein
MIDAPQEVLAGFVETPIFVEIGIFVFASVMCVLFVVAVIKGANDKEWAKDQRMLAERDRHLMVLSKAIADLEAKK